MSELQMEFLNFLVFVYKLGHVCGNWILSVLAEDGKSGSGYCLGKCWKYRVSVEKELIK